MTKTLRHLINKMTLQEKKEVETFAAFIITRRKLEKNYLVADDVPINELIEVISGSGGFHWLKADDEDIYSIDDGEEIEWPQLSNEVV
ncbi:hypothetical protein MHK_003184 [Candidatus Magnetomorum sp. HK-1]|nr:hypothetical protein MHK_003184 [Candidatus Magnetomorum sp. HK-1]